MCPEIVSAIAWGDGSYIGDDALTTTHGDGMWKGYNGKSRSKVGVSMVYGVPLPLVHA